MLSGKIKSMALEIISGSDAIIFGSHANIGEYTFTYKLSNAKTIIFSNKNMVMHTEILNYYKNKTVYFLPSRVELIR